MALVSDRDTFDFAAAVAADEQLRRVGERLRG